jgi:hypothetical protein
MSDIRALRLRFVLETHSKDRTDASDFVAAFSFVDDLSRAVAENEARDLVEALGFRGDARFDAFQSISRFQQLLPPPAEVDNIERGSWVIDTVIPGTAILFILKNTIGRTLSDAWDESSVREQLLGFLRETVFRGAARRVQERAIETPQHGTLRVANVREIVTRMTHEPVIEITLRRAEVASVRISEEQLIEGILKQFRR